MNNLSPVWKPFKVSLNTLCSGDPDRELKVSQKVTLDDLPHCTQHFSSSWLSITIHLVKSCKKYLETGVKSVKWRGSSTKSDKLHPDELLQQLFPSTAASSFFNFLFFLLSSSFYILLFLVLHWLFIFLEQHGTIELHCHNSTSAKMEDFCFWNQLKIRTLNNCSWTPARWMSPILLLPLSTGFKLTCLPFYRTFRTPSRHSHKTY